MVNQGIVPGKPRVNKTYEIGRRQEATTVSSEEKCDVPIVGSSDDSARSDGSSAAYLDQARPW